MDASDDPGGGDDKSYCSDETINDKNNTNSLQDWNNLSDIETEYNLDSDLNNSRANSQSNINQFKDTNSIAQKKPVENKYSDKDSGPFLVYLESNDKSGNNVGRFNDLKIAREIFNLNLRDVKKNRQQGAE